MQAFAEPLCLFLISLPSYFALLYSFRPAFLWVFVAFLPSMRGRILAVIASRVVFKRDVLFSCALYMRNEDKRGTCLAQKLLELHCHLEEIDALFFFAGVSIVAKPLCFILWIFVRVVEQSC